MNRKFNFFFNIHPFFFAVYIPLFLFSHNMAEVSPSQLPAPIAALLALSLVLWIVAYITLRSPAKAALAASVCLFSIFFYEHFHLLFESLIGRGIPHRYLLPVWLLFFLGVLVLIWRARQSIEIASLGASVFAISILIVPSLEISLYYLTPANARISATSDRLIEFEIAEWSQGELPLRDIYYIVLDGYGRSDQLKRHYGFDNTGFLTDLKDLGFFIGENSTSNYRTTPYSLRSSLNMRYVHVAEKKLEFSLTSNKVALILKKIGYKYIFIPSGYKITNFAPLADIVLRSTNVILDEFSIILFDWSVPGLVWNRFFPKEKDSRWRKLITTGLVSTTSDIGRWAKHITRSFDLLKEIPDIEGPKFTFAHIISPHPPIVFNADGSLNNRASILDFSNINEANAWHSPDMAGQFAHLNRLVKSAVSDIIRKSSPRPIILIHGDHGTKKTFGLSARVNLSNPSRKQVRERMSIFLAIYGPEKLFWNSYNSISPVNLFRTVFNAEFDAKLKLLPDRSYWQSNDDQIFLDVTDMHLVGPSN